jgi:hypothetical protein
MALMVVKLADIKRPFFDCLIAKCTKIKKVTEDKKKVL